MSFKKIPPEFDFIDVKAIDKKFVYFIFFPGFYSFTDIIHTSQRYKVDVIVVLDKNLNVSLEIFT
jgi:uncharacterized membrane protein